MHNPLIFYVRVPEAYISSLILFFFYILYVWVYFQSKFWGFLHNRAATLVTIGEQKISLKSDLKKIIFNDSDDCAGLVVVAVFKISSKYVGKNAHLLQEGH